MSRALRLKIETRPMKMTMPAVAAGMVEFGI
jgi:hypothetical protein